jgi:hypothetical protein
MKARRQVAAIKNFYIHLFIFALVMLGSQSIPVERVPGIPGS